MKQALKLLSLEDAKQELLRLKQSKTVNTPNWDISEICLHCAQTINYSITGYPVMKSPFIRNTIGKIAYRKFKRQGFMSHSLTAHVPGGDQLEVELSPQDSIQKLLDTIETFQNYTGALKPHLLFGNLTKAEYDQYFAMHIADHFSELDY